MRCVAFADEGRRSQGDCRRRAPGRVDPGRGRAPRGIHSRGRARRRRRGGFPRFSLCRGGSRARRRCLRRRGRGRQGGASGRGRGRAAAVGPGARLVLAAVDREGPARRAPKARRPRFRDGIDSENDARPGDGCALVAGDGLRLQGSTAGRRAAAAVPADADDGGGNDPAGADARPRRGRCRVCRRSRQPAGSARSSQASTFVPR